MLSKIGKPNSPPRHLRSDSAESTQIAAKLSLQTRDPKTSRLAVTDIPSATSDNLSRWVSSPLSGGASPGSRPGWRDYMDYRSPSSESASTSLVLDPELFLQSRSSGKQSVTGAYPINDDSTSQASRSQRGSYDHTMYADPDHELPGEENGGFRNLNLNTQQHHLLERKASRQGMKRRALSPPSEVARDDKSSAYPLELSTKMSGSNPARSPAAAYRPHPAYGSMSSTASSIRQSSYASSFAPSLAGSSLTSISSYDRNSPSDPSHIPFITSAHPVSSPATSIAPSRKQTFQQSPRDVQNPARTMSVQTAVSESRPPTASRIGSYYICDCCPKKPKKFDTEDELR